jgi:hypothetical protein
LILYENNIFYKKQSTPEFYFSTLGVAEVGFSMVRLKEIAALREMFSSIESLSNESSDSDVSFAGT